MPVGSSPFVLLDDRLGSGEKALLFQDPDDIVICTAPDDLDACLTRIEDALAQGHHAAGYCAYELGYLMEPRLAPLLPATRPAPLLWFGLFPPPETLTGEESAAFLRSRMTGGHRLTRVTPTLDEATYIAHIERVLRYIRAGDIYQANFTFPLDVELTGDPVSLYAALRARQRVSHGALIQTGDATLLSLSPELFFETDGRAIRARPMKGTVRRATDPDEDDRLAHWLAQDAKNRAENLMIVDLLRNDLSRLAEIGSVQVPHLFAVETYETLHTMTSTVEARLRPGTTTRALLRALYPCGSITGAPKIRAMEIIRDLEREARGSYTGSIGHFAPDGSAHMNVAIRTITVDETGRGRMGVGGGIVSDSDPQAEYQEALLKARFVLDETEPFSLIETMRGSDTEGIPLLDLHMARLGRSAAWFNMPCDLETLHRLVANHMAMETYIGEMRVRLTLDTDGRVTLTSAPLAPQPETHRFVIADTPIDAADPFYGHKTTRRTLYDDTHARLTAHHGCDEVVFLNRWGRIAEGSRSTLFIEEDGTLITPPQEEGALPGVMKAHLRRTRTVVEMPLTLEQIQQANRIFLANAVWGLVPAALASQTVSKSGAAHYDPPRFAPARQ